MLLNKQGRSCHASFPARAKMFCLDGQVQSPPSKADCWRAIRRLQDGTEKLLLPKGVFRGWHRRQQRVLFGVGFAVRHHVCRCFWHLYPVNVGLHLQLLHQFPGLSDAGCVVGRHWRCLSAWFVLSTVTPPHWLLQRRQQFVSALRSFVVLKSHPVLSML